MFDGTSFPPLNLPSGSAEPLPTPRKKTAKYHSLPLGFKSPFALDPRPLSERTPMCASSSSSEPLPRVAMRLLPPSPLGRTPAPPLKVELPAPPLKVQLSEAPELEFAAKHKRQELLKSNRMTRSTGDLVSLATPAPLPKDPKQILESKVSFLESQVIAGHNTDFVIELYHCYRQQGYDDKALQVILDAVVDVRYDNGDQIFVTLGNHYMGMQSQFARSLALRYFNRVSPYSTCHFAHSQAIHALRSELILERERIVDQVSGSIEILKQQLERLNEKKTLEECEFVKYVMSSNRFFSQALEHAQPLLGLACEICHIIGIPERDIPSLPENPESELEKRQAVEIIQWWLEEVNEIMILAGRRLEQAALQGERS